MKRRTRPFLFLLTILVVAASLRPCRAGGLDKVVARAREAGAPIFVLVTSTYCAPCRELKHRLDTEEELQALINQYVGIHFDVSDPVFRRWTSVYKPKAMTVPMLFIVTSKGQLVYNESGAPDSPQMAAILREGLRRNNTEQAKPVDPADGWKQRSQAARDVQGRTNRTQAARQADELIEQGRYAAAVRVLKQYLSDNDTAAPADLVNDDDPIAPRQARLWELGRDELNVARAGLTHSRLRLFALIAVAKTQRVFGDLPGFEEEVGAVLAEVQHDAEHARQLEQVELIDRGRAAELAGDYTAAVGAYRQVLDDHPDSLAARLCAARILQIVPERVATRAEKDDGETERR